MIRKFLNFFKRKPSELEILTLNFLKGDGLKQFSEYQQIEIFKQKEIERNKRLKEKFDYLFYKKTNNFTLTIEEEKELDYLTFYFTKTL
jgi:hypothetical protein